MGAEKTLVNVSKGQDPYSVIGNYISNHVTAIEDMIAVIKINGVVTKELYMVDVDADGYFYWKNDWWEGEEDVALLDFFPVSDAERIEINDSISRQWLIECVGEGWIKFDTEKDENTFMHLVRDIAPSVRPDPHYNKWCTDCKEYDQERHCCPRWNRVISQTVKEMKR